jgi:glycosyltransferase involved in cell wall biosynthesis
MHALALVVPTKDRPEDMRTLMQSLRQQTRKADQLIVVDGSDPDIRRVIDEFPDLQIDYVRVFPPSLSKQRNAGMARLNRAITLAGYLDDDIVLEPDAIESMLGFWESADDDIGGASFNIVNAPMPNKVFVKRWFGIEDRVPGKLLKSGCPTTLGPQDRNIETDWLCGGATVWRRSIVESYKYDEWFVGTGFMEDVDFSFKVKERYRLFLISSARLAHYMSPVRPERQYLLGMWQILNRMYLVRKYRHRGLSVWRAWVAHIGLLMLNVGQAMLKGDIEYLSRARGNFAGILILLRGETRQVGGFLK